MEKQHVPHATFQVRALNDANEYEWKELTTDEIFNEKRVAVFALPGAFTPTCSSTHLPGYEVKANELKELGIDEIYCLSVNDTFVMNAWAKDQNVSNVKMIPDGNAEFTDGMGMLVRKHNLGFGDRSWRYSMVVKDGIVEKMFIEEGKEDNHEEDPFEVSDVDTMIEYLAR